MLGLALAVLSASAAPAALACAGHAALPLERRAVNAARPGASFARRAPALDRTTEQGEAQITDPTQECSYYNYPPANALLPTYPTIWATADLSAPGITEHDKALFRAINATVPDIQPRGTRAGDFTGVVYDGNADPDCWWSYNKCTTPKLAGLPKDVIKCNEPNTWGFTLDDGPNCSHNAYFDYLQSIEQKATLFYIGSNVLDWPLEAQRGLSDGHEICSHTWSHPYMTSMTNEQAFAELYFSKKAIKDILGITVRCWRPPYGDVDDRIRYIAEQLDMRTVIWTEDTMDWEWTELGVPAVEERYEAIFKKQQQGKYDSTGIIVLSHEIDGMTMNISQSYLPRMQQAFTGGVMPVAVCMNNTEPYLETSDYVYPNYAQYVAGTHSISLAAPTAATRAGGDEVEFAATSATATAAASSSSSSSAAASQSTTSAATSTGAGSTASAAAQSLGTSNSTTSTSSAAPSSFFALPALALAAAVAGGAAVLA
ncbi:hypothetical protein JCM10213_006000 [Rhodosporidiobolus nylandii]